MPYRFLLLLLLAVPARAAGPAVLPAPDGPAAFFGLDKLWDMHLTLTAEEWKRMQPKSQSKAGDGQVRSQFGYVYEYVKARLDIGGKTLHDVGLRFKGNSTYATTSRILKRPFKIDFDRHIPRQSFLGVRKLSLNVHVMDHTACREALGYAVYREAGVPAPRTAFGLLSITVPGRYDREVVGVYTLVENVDKPFLKDRFGSSKGMLLKPEGVGPLEHLGSQWADYEKKYRPRTAASKKAQKRLMDLTKLVQDRDESRFQARIASYLDVDKFLRYLAATVTLSSMDSFMGLPHNYYLYLDPRTDRFVVMPWDLDHSFGSLDMFCTAEQLTDLSIRQPWLGRNPLVQRILKNPTHYATYTSHIESLLAVGFKPARMKRDAAAITSLLAPAREKEKRAVSKRGDAWSMLPLGLLMRRAPAVEVFTTKRVASLRAQLDGARKGFVITRSFRRPRPNQALPVQAIVKAIDENKDGKVSLSEARNGAAALFKRLDRKKKGILDEKALAAELARVLPRQGFFAPAPTALARRLAKGILQKAGKTGKLESFTAVETAARLFKESDPGKTGMLTVTQVEEALRRLLPPAPGIVGPAARAEAR